MLETTVEILRAPVAVLGFGGVLIALGIILSDKRRYLPGSRSQQTNDDPERER